MSSSYKRFTGIFTACVLVVGCLTMVGTTVWYKSNTGEKKAKQQIQATIQDQSGNSMDVPIAELMAQLKENPEDPEVLVNLGKLFFEAEEWVRAETFFDRAVKSDPLNTLFLEYLSQSQYQQGKYTSAAENLEMALVQKRDHKTLFNLAIIYKYRLHEQEKAKNLLLEINNSNEVTDTVKQAVTTELKKTVSNQ